MNKRFYLDTSIWLDLFEQRDELNLPKCQLAQKLLDKIVEENDNVIYSDVHFTELKKLGYTYFEIKRLFYPFKHVLLLVSSNKFVGKSRNIAKKRNIPQGDIIHALIARNTNSILVTRDKHFQKLLDITKPRAPEELI